MNKRPVNKNNPKNIKCEHCKHWDKEHKTTITMTNGYVHLPIDLPMCTVSGDAKYYYNRCKNFEWAERYNQEEEEC